MAIEAWRKATDNKIKSFPSNQGDAAMGYGVPGGGPGIIQELDAGRVIGPGYTDSADPRTRRDEAASEAVPLDEFEGLPPGYDGPPTPRGEPSQQQDPMLVEALEGRLNGETGRPTSLTASESGRTNRDGGDTEGSASPPPLAMMNQSSPPVARNSIEAGVSELARLRALKEERERIEEEKNRRERNGDDP